MTVADRIREHGDRLTPAERRIAAVLLDTPQTVGFGTVADLAEASSAGAATVVRLANKLGYDGYVGLQQAVQRELSGQLGPAAERIRLQREGGGLDDVRMHTEIEQSNVASTLEQIDSSTTRVVVDRLSDELHAVLVLSGAASRGVALQLVIDLGQLRRGVSLLDGNDVDVMRALALAGESPTVVAIDIRRYDRWVVDTLRTAADPRRMDRGADRQRVVTAVGGRRPLVPRQRRLARAVRQSRRNARVARRARRRRGGDRSRAGDRPSRPSRGAWRADRRCSPISDVTAKFGAMATISRRRGQMAMTDDVDDNVATAERLVREAAEQGAQIILIPELFEGPYFCKDQLPEHLGRAIEIEGHPTIEHFARVAAELEVVLPLSVYERAGQALFNTVVVVDADGSTLGKYRKSHIPDGPGYTEKYYFSPGDTGFRVWDTAPRHDRRRHLLGPVVSRVGALHGAARCGSVPVPDGDRQRATGPDVGFVRPLAARHAGTRWGEPDAARRCEPVRS